MRFFISLVIELNNKSLKLPVVKEQRAFFKKKKKKKVFDIWQVTVNLRPFRPIDKIFIW